jgi:hypothetical protein
MVKGNSFIALSNFMYASGEKLEAEGYKKWQI